MKTQRFIYLAGGAVIVALLLFLIRENEARNAAQAKLLDLQFKTETVQNEKENAINDLQVQVSELDSRLSEAHAKYDMLVVQKNEEIDTLNARMQEEIASREGVLQQKVEELGALETRMKEADEQWSGLLKNKNAEISGLGDQLQQMSAKTASLLKEKQDLELKVMGCQSHSLELEREVDSLRTENAVLLQAKQSLEKQDLENQAKPLD